MTDRAKCEAALREALDLVDALGDYATACHLSMALDTFLQGDRATTAAKCDEGEATLNFLSRKHGS